MGDKLSPLQASWSSSKATADLKYHPAAGAAPQKIDSGNSPD